MAGEMANHSSFYLNEGLSHISSLDLSLYLVTDSSIVPPSSTLAQHVEAAIKGGVTVVQLREKKASTREFIRIAREIHATTQRHKVPLLINDRVDVALAVGCEGVHIGWDDMEYETVRRLVGPRAFIGISVSNKAQFYAAKEQIEVSGQLTYSNTYFGVGPVYATATKPDHNPPLGLNGLRILLSYGVEDIETVAIGGINKGNVYSILHPLGERSRGPTGVAVVSAIMAAPDAEQASRELLTLIKSPSGFRSRMERIPHFRASAKCDVTSIRSQAISLFSSIPSSSPLVHNITNNVVKNIAANITLAIGASPIMSENIEEAADLAEINGALVVNMGTAVDNFYELVIEAITQNNVRGKPVIFDPVGAGATKYRRELTRKIITGGYCDVIKGNRAEILTVAGELVTMKGVDSGGDGELGMKELADIVKRTALKEENIIVMTGKVDIVSDGHKTFGIDNGHEILEKVTGTGCSLASVIGACLATNDCKGAAPNKMSRVVIAILAYTIAAEYALMCEEGPGRFMPIFLDVLHEMAANPDGRIMNNSQRWVDRAHILVMDS